MEPSHVRTRFAPSPTGALHVGGVRTALFDWLWAKKNHGTFVLRIEDTDRDRYNEQSVAAISDGLAWLGLQPDEGPREGGPFGPYIQSQRLERYGKAAEELVRAGAAFRCFCTEERLEALRDEQAARKEPPRYDGRCLRLSAAEVAARGASRMPSVVRLKIPEEGSMTHTDGIRGSLRFAWKTIDHAVLLKSDGFPTYHLASCVDDHAMEITHVFRGEEWLPSLPKHLRIYQALGWEPPVFFHLPLILGPDRSKLSKRHGAASVLEFREQGFVPDALVNFLALLGWNPKNDRELFTREELIEAFSLEHLNRSPAIFDLVKLRWFNAQAIRRLPADDRAARIGAGLREAFPNADLSEERIAGIVELVGERIERFADVPDTIRFLFAEEPYDPLLLIPKNGTAADTIAALTQVHEWLSSVGEGEWSPQTVRKALESGMAGGAADRRSVLWPTRVAITFRAHSPGVFEVLAFLGRKESLRRIQRGLSLLRRSSQA